MNQALAKLSLSFLAIGCSLMLLVPIGLMMLVLCAGLLGFGLQAVSSPDNRPARTSSSEIEVETPAQPEPLEVEP
jgi:hypothetical protein